jgi:hypothetical protein
MLDHLGLTRAFGVFSLIISLGFLFNLRHYEAMAKKMVGEPSGFIMGGVLPLLIGVLIIHFSYEVQFAWTMTLNVIGWVLFLIAVFRICFVNFWIKIMKRYIDFVPILFALFGLIFGILLCYSGFIMPLYH